MASTIERVNYYEQQYLRSFDFTAEQDYHLAMRRRLNLALHLCGLVDGLEVTLGPTDPAVDADGNTLLPDQVYVTPGLAIDGYGREIVRFATFAIDGDVLADNKISLPGAYGVYVAYQRELGTPPDAGYRVCNAKDQYTRWFETGRIFLSSDAQPAPAVATTDELPDDPDAAPWPVRLGAIQVAFDSSGTRLVASAVNAPKPGDRKYVGIRAQRIVAPVTALAAEKDKDDKAMPITAEADFRATKNAIVGTDFKVDKAKVVPPPPAADPNFPGDAGNLRIEKNLFLKGDVYKSVGDQWLGLSELFRQMIPEVRIANGIEIETSASSTDPPNNKIDLPADLLTSKVLKNPASASVFVALCAVELQAKKSLQQWWAKLTAPANGAAIDFGVTVSSLAKKAGTDNVFEGSLSWSVGPKSITALPADAKILTTKLKVNVIVIFSP
ncbi:MAG TPA: hypothetical protein VKB52_05380 [Rhodanobacteraceae bacterium]|nr:hypothetical protein [Rhodanobacteraceae bacterium]